MAKWWEIQSAIKDAKQNIDYARSEASEFLIPDAPDADQWPAALELISALDRLSAEIPKVFTESINRAIKEEEEADYEAECRADAMSY